MKKLTLLTCALVFVVSWCSAAGASSAFDLFTGGIDNGSGPSYTLYDWAEHPSSGYTADIGGQTVLVGQPELKLEQLRGGAMWSWTGMGICIDTSNFIYVGVPYPDYHVYDWSGAKAAQDASPSGHKLGSIDPSNRDVVWNKLTWMWENAVVSSDSDRAALQLATWLGCGNIWTWQSMGGNTETLRTAVEGYLSLAIDDPAYSDSYVIFANESQTFVGGVPEPGTISAMCAMLAPVGFMFRRRRS